MANSVLEGNGLPELTLMHPVLVGFWRVALLPLKVPNYYLEFRRNQASYGTIKAWEFCPLPWSRKVLAECDIAISTAAIPGRPSPLLITKEAVAGMKPGSVPCLREVACGERWFW